METRLYKPKIAIIGAGIWGLSCAYHLLKKRPEQIDLVVMESNERPGGMIQTVAFSDHFMETGPNGFLDSNPITLELCKELGLEDHLLPASASAARNRYLFLNNRLHKLPSNLLGMAFSPVLSFSSKIRLLTEGVRSKRQIPEEESIADFFRARAGEEVANTVGDAFVTGIWGGNSEELSLPSCFPKWRQMENEYGSILRGFKARRIAKARAAREAGLPKPSPPRMWSLKKGLGQLIETLAARLGPRLKTNTKVSALQPAGDRRETGWLVFQEGEQNPDRFDQVVLACPAHEQARLLAPLSPALSGTLSQIQTSPIAVVGLKFRDNQLSGNCVKPDGFGYLTPQRDCRPILGVQWCSSIFPVHRVPLGWQLWRALVGGPQQKQLLDLGDSALTELVLKELKIVGNWNISPESVHIYRWRKAIPQYTLGHSKKIQAIMDAQKKLPGMNCAGSSFGGVAINDCVEQSAAFSKRLTEGLVKISD